MNFTAPDGLLWLASALLAVLFDWVPAVSNKYDLLTAGQKRFWMAVFVLVAAILIFGVSCLNLFGLTLACNMQGALSMLVSAILAIVINQGFHAGTKPA